MLDFPRSSSLGWVVSSRVSSEIPERLHTAPTGAKGGVGEDSSFSLAPEFWKCNLHHRSLFCLPHSCLLSRRWLTSHLIVDILRCSLVASCVFNSVCSSFVLMPCICVAP